MRDAMVSAAAVFEPEEVTVLAAALRRALKKIGAASGPLSADIKAEMARLVHNLGRSRVRLRKPMATEGHAAEIADEAVELFAYLEEAPDAVLAAAREVEGIPKFAERIIGTFPSAFRQPPVKRL